MKPDKPASKPSTSGPKPTEKKTGPAQAPKSTPGGSTQKPTQPKR